MKEASSPGGRATRLCTTARSLLYVSSRFAFAFGVLHVIDNFLGSTKQARGLSMSPTIREGGDILLFERVTLQLRRFFGWPKVRRGEVVLAHSPEDACVVCKRIVAVGGDIFIPDPPAEASFKPQSVVVVPKNHVWLQGDNASMSHDSRNYGSVSEALLCGRVVCKIWPPTLSPFFKRSLPSRLLPNFLRPTPLEVAADLAKD
ncbi:hypothetical protein ACSSS7_001868 [Eimeria intestinalis]